MDDRDERFRRIFDSCYQPLHAYARRRANAGDADDLVADVLTTAWRRLDDLPSGMELAWLYGVARRSLANQRRGATRRLRLLERLAAEPPAAAAPAPSDDVVTALQRLRPDDRELLRLAAWEGLDVAEIAVALGCTTNAAALRLSRARKRLREKLTAQAASRTQAAGKVTDA